MTNIFDQTNKVGASDNEKVNYPFFTFKEIGDKISGTLICKREGLNNFGNNQKYYDLLKEDGEIVTIPGTSTIDSSMEQDDIQPGQIIGLEYVGKKTTKSNRVAKIIDVYANKNVVNKEWLEAQLSNAKVKSEVSQPATTQDTGSSDVPQVNYPSSNQEELNKETEIHKIIFTKYGLTDKAKVIQKVAELTNLAWVPANFDKILEILNK